MMPTVNMFNAAEVVTLDEIGDVSEINFEEITIEDNADDVGDKFDELINSLSEESTNNIQDIISGVKDVLKKLDNHSDANFNLETSNLKSNDLEVIEIDDCEDEIEQIEPSNVGGELTVLNNSKDLKDFDVEVSRKDNSIFLLETSQDIDIIDITEGAENSEPHIGNEILKDLNNDNIDITKETENTEIDIIEETKNTAEQNINHKDFRCGNDVITESLEINSVSSDLDHHETGAIKKSTFEKDDSVTDQDLKDNDSSDDMVVTRNCSKSDVKSWVEKRRKSFIAKDRTAKCHDCRQRLSDVKVIKPHRETKESREENVIQDPRINIDEDGSVGEALQFKLTDFTVYCRSGHIVPIFAADILNVGKKLYFSGKVQMIIADPSDETGVELIQGGPISEWSNGAGQDDINEDIILSTVVGNKDVEYHLVKPSDVYGEIFHSVYRMAYMSNKIITRLCSMNDQNLFMEYGELIEFINDLPQPNFHGKLLPIVDEEFLQLHADFLVTQVTSFDEAGDVNEDLTIQGMPCIKHLAAITGVERARKKLVSGPRNTAQPEVHVKAVTTPLVAALFESTFQKQMQSQKKSSRKALCTCKACQARNCGKCQECNNMKSFGGEVPDDYLTCSLRLNCPNREDIELLLDDEDDLNDDDNSEVVNVIWPTNEGVKKGSRVLYKSATLEKRNLKESFTVRAGQCVLVKPDEEEEGVPHYVGIIKYLCQVENMGSMCHVQWLARSEDTVLGNTGDPKEYFLLNSCETIGLSCVTKIIDIQNTPITDVDLWRKNGGTAEAITEDDQGGKDGWWRLCYTPAWGRFEIPKTENLEMIGECSNCIKMINKNMTGVSLEDLTNETYGAIRIVKEKFHVNDFMYLEDETLSFNIKKKPLPVVKKDPKKAKDPLAYPEYYRKPDVFLGDHHNTWDPLQVVRLEEVKEEEGVILMRVRQMYRPQDTHLEREEARTKPLSCLYWTEEMKWMQETDIEERVVGKAWVKGVAGGSLDEATNWTDQGQNRFFISQIYDSEGMSFKDLPMEIADDLESEAKSAPHTSEVKPLRLLDIFSGCGGLSRGLHDSKVAETKWAIEFWKPAAEAYGLNNPDCKVFNRECNSLLEMLLTGKNDIGLPEKGDVEMLSGGPPCQGFSVLNIFKEKEYSKFKNSLIPTYLSFADFYRPKYFILENVRNLVANENGMVLKLCMATLVRMGYQAAFGILQAGHYGVSQTRRRLIIMAAAPGETLPLFPEPVYCFPGPLFLEVEIDGRRFSTNTSRPGCPRRALTAWDSISDLRPIKSGASDAQISYSFFQDGVSHTGEPKSHLQKMFRAGQPKGAPLIDHICKEMNALSEVRIRNIPTDPGSDWRDLPNFEMKMENGEWTKSLQYNYSKPGEKGLFRGVCSCCLKNTGCDNEDKQSGTLISWFLPHTADRHNNWKEVYGRVPWDGIFKTTITDPEPLGKQGQVLHPDQNRLVSVREYARSQGFPDTYKFAGTIRDKHREIGNAVPPPLGKAIGMEIRKAICK